MASEAFDVMQRHQRARSLEHILDQGQSSIGPNYWVADGAKLISHKRGGGAGGGGGPSVSQAHTPSMTPKRGPAHSELKFRKKSIFAGKNAFFSFYIF